MLNADSTKGSNTQSPDKLKDRSCYVAFRKRARAGEGASVAWTGMSWKVEATARFGGCSWVGATDDRGVKIVGCRYAMPGDIAATSNHAGMSPLEFEADTVCSLLMLHFAKEFLDLGLRLLIQLLILCRLLLRVAQFLELGLQLLVLGHEVGRERLGESGSPCLGVSNRKMGDLRPALSCRRWACGDQYVSGISPGASDHGECVWKGQRLCPEGDWRATHMSLA